MGCIFISHVIDDAPLMQEIAEGLEAAGYTAWYFERDVLPGTSYLIQITRAIECCDALILLVTPKALESDQVTKEVVGAFERRVPFFPVLVEVTPSELKEHQPEWRHALGGTAMFTVGPEGLPHAVSRVVEGLRAMGIEPGEEKASYFNPVLSTPKSEAPKHLADKIIASRSAMEGERKQVTVLHTEVTGLTSSDRLDPEELHDLLRPCIDIMAEEIHLYEGTVAHLTSHGLMALFGAPIAHEDAPQRAIHAALAIRDRIRRYKAEIEDREMDCDLHAGIHTGLVIVGRIGDDLSMEYSAIGDTVNLASEIEKEAEPGSINVSEDTHHLTSGYFDFEELGEIGTADGTSIKLYRVLSPRHAASRVEASLAKGLTRFVGREKKLEHLTDCLKRTQEGQGQVVGIVGEPGVGKSRLILEFTSSLPEGEYTCLEGGCYHYGEAIPYLPILEILRDYFEVGEEEDQETIKVRIGEKVAQFDGHLDDITPPLHEVLSLKVEDVEYLKLEPAQSRERVFEAIRRLLISESQVKSLVVVIEDLHWVDKTSEEFLAFLIDHLGSAPVLLVLLYRPEYAPAWTSKACYSQVRVDQLPQERSADLVASILSKGEVAPEISDLIASRASGNPLFIEELTHGLLENGSIVKDDDSYVLSGKPSDIEVPDTIQGIIASRLDRLEESLKRLMQVASVIGREFAYRLLEAITSLKEELKSYLSNLQELEFIYEKSLFPELEYIFKHALTQEVAYGSLLLKRRREIHERIGQAIEHIYEDRLEEFHEMLAYHYQRSTDTEKAIHYLRLSGDKAARGYANWEAISFYKEAIRLLDDQPEGEENEKEKMEVYVSMLNPLLFLGFPEGGLEALQDAEMLAKELGDDVNLAAVYSKLSHYYSMKGELSLGMEYSEKCYYTAEKVGDVESMATIAMDIGLAMNFTGRFLEVAAMSRRVIELLEERHIEKDLFAGGRNVFVNQCGCCGLALGGLGELEEGKAFLEKGLKLALEVGDAYGVGYVEYLHSSLLLWEGDGKGIIDHARRSIERWEEMGIELMLGQAWSFLGAGYYLLGDYEAARAHAEKGLEIQRRSAFPVLVPFICCLLAPIRAAGGDLDGAMESAGEALNLSREFGARAFEPLALVTLGRIAGEADPSQVEVAEGYIRQGIAMSEEMKGKWGSACGYQYLGETFEIAGRREEALENLRKAEEMYQEMGVSPKSYWLTRAREALTRLGQ